MTIASTSGGDITVGVSSEVAVGVDIGGSSMRFMMVHLLLVNSGFVVVKDKSVLKTAQLLADCRAHGGTSLQSHNGHLDILDNQSDVDSY